MTSAVEEVLGQENGFTVAGLNKKKEKKRANCKVIKGKGKAMCASVALAIFP